MKYRELEQLLTEWADNRNLLKPSNAHKQYIKFCEESGELAKSILKNDKDQLVDDLGDVFVTLVILSKQLNVDLFDSIQMLVFKKKDTFEELLEQMLLLGNNLNLLHKSNAPRYYLLFKKASGQLADAILNTELHSSVVSSFDIKELRKHFGNVIFYLNVLSHQLGFKIVGCLETAYNEIKDREGKTVDGTFIRN